MARRIIDTFWDRKTRNDINDNFEELYDNLISEIGPIRPEDTTFFTSENLFSGEYYSKKGYILPNDTFPDGSLGTTTSNASKTAIVPIKRGVKYTIHRGYGGDRFYIMIVDEVVTSNVPLLFKNLVSRDDPSEESYSFTSNYNGYLAVQVSSSKEPPNYLRITDDVSSYKLDERYLPTIQPEKEFSFNFYANLHQLYRKEGEIEGYFENPEDISSAEYHEKFKQLIDSHSVIASRKIIGEASGGYDLYEYEIKPPIFYVGNEDGSGEQSGEPLRVPKVLMITGIHGYERSVSLSMYYYFKELLENPTNSDLIEFLKMNVHLKVVALANPYGFDNDKYTNANGYNLNRAFPPEVDSNQKEVLTLIDWIKENTDMDFFFDFHNINSGLRSSKIGFSYSDNEMFRQTITSMYKNLGRSWQKEYSEMPQNIDYEWAFNVQAIPSSVSNYVQETYDIPATLFEVTNELNWLGGGKFGEPTARLGIEIIINSLIGALRSKM